MCAAAAMFFYAALSFPSLCASEVNPVYVNVKAFGAVGDGVTNDTSAIQAAISYVQSTDGGTVLFPAGTYIVNSTLNVIKTLGIVLQGVSGFGSGSSIIMFTLSDSSTGIDARGSSGFEMHYIQVAYNSSTYSGTLVDLSFLNTSFTLYSSITNSQFYQTNSATNTKSAYTLLYLDGVTGCMIENCTFKGAQNLILGSNPSNGFYPPDLVTFDHCVFTDWSHVAIYCPGNTFKFDTCWFDLKGSGAPAIGNNNTVSCTNLTVINSSFSNCTASNPAIISFYYTYNINFYSCDFDGGGQSNTNAFYLSANNFAWDIRSCSFSKMTNGIVLNFGTGFLDGATINGNVFESSVTTPFIGYAQLGNNVNFDANAIQNINFIGSANWTPGTITNGTSVHNDFACAGAVTGDFALASPPYDLQGVSMTVSVISSGFVRVSLYNGTGASVSLGAGVWKVRAFRE